MNTVLLNTYVSVDAYSKLSQTSKIKVRTRTSVAIEICKTENQCKTPRVFGPIDGTDKPIFSLKFLFLKAGIIIIGQNREIPSILKM